MIDDQGKVDWLDAFRIWFGQNREVLDRRSITVDMPAETRGNGIYADLKSERYEATVQLWNNGLSDFHILDWRSADHDSDYQVEVTHHEFQNESGLSTALGTLVKRMSEDDEPPSTTENWPISGYSETVYYPPSGNRLPFPRLKGRPNELFTD